MRPRTFALGAAVAAALSACPPARVDTAAEEQAIRAVVDTLNQAIAAKNDSAIVALYTPDAVMMPPNEGSVSGVSGMRAFWAEMWPMNASLVITPANIDVTGDLAVEEGTWAFEMATPAGPQRDNGKYLTSWRKVDGAWRMTRDIWNSDNAPPPPPADTTKQQT